MDFWYVLIGVVALIVLFPYIRCFFKRLTCMGKIKRLCRRKSYKLHKTHVLWFLGCKWAKRCDCYIETPNEVFAIKLFGMPRRRTILILKDNREYFIRSFITIVSYGSAMRSPINGKPKPIPTYDFRYRYKDEWEIKTPRHILLVNPVSMEFRRQPQRGSETVVNAGDVVNGIEMASLFHLLSEIENEDNSSKIIE